MPYTITTKQTVYVYIKKDLLPIINKVLEEDQLLIIYSLNCISPEEDLAKRVKAKAKKDISRFIPIKIDDAFMDNVYKPKAVSLLRNENNSFIDLVIGFMMVTGRRPAEIVQSMELDFTPYEKTGYVIFSGQKKKPKSFGGTGCDALNIPLLLNKEHLPLLKERYETLTWVRQHYIVKGGKALTELTPRDFSNWSGALRNAYTKRMPELNTVLGKTLYVLRSVYACYMLANDNNKTMTPSAYLSNILGHNEDDRNHLNYEKICYSQNKAETDIHENKKNETLKKLNNIRNCITAFVSKKDAKYSPSSILPCELSLVRKKIIKGYSFYLCFGRSEDSPIVSLYLPSKCKAKDKIKVLAITEKGTDTIDWIKDKSGLCKLILEKYVPEFEFKKSKKENKVDRIKSDFELKKDKKTKKEN